MHPYAKRLGLALLVIACAGSGGPRAAAGDQDKGSKKPEPPILLHMGLDVELVKGVAKVAGKVYFFRTMSYKRLKLRPTAILSVLPPTLTPTDGVGGRLFVAGGNLDHGLLKRATKARSATLRVHVYDFARDPAWHKVMTARMRRERGVKGAEVHWPRWRENAWLLRAYARPATGEWPELIGSVKLPRRSRKSLLEARIPLDPAALKLLGKVRRDTGLWFTLTAEVRVMFDAESFAERVPRRISDPGGKLTGPPLGWSSKTKKWARYALCAGQDRPASVRAITDWFAQTEAAEFRLGPLLREYDFQLESIRGFARPYAESVCVEVPHDAIGACPWVLMDGEFAVAVDRKALRKSLADDEASLAKVLRALIVKANALRARGEAHDADAGLLLMHNWKSEVATERLDARSRALAKHLRPILRVLAAGRGPLYGIDLERLDSVTASRNRAKVHGKPALEHWVELHFTFRASGEHFRPRSDLPK